jgi:hypothetical protein
MTPPLPHRRAGAAIGILRTALAIALACPCAILLLLSGGCLIHPWNPAATQPATVVDLATTQPSYWLSMPPTAGVTSSHYAKLWDACENAARDHLFDLDRQDYREGLITTKPLVSRQFFEPWRPDIYTRRDEELSSTCAIRRTIRFEFTRLSTDSWVVTPIVLVERQSILERRLTASVTYRDAYIVNPKSNDEPAGTREEDLGLYIQNRYWYVTGRDTHFELALAKRIRRKVSASKLTLGAAATQPASTSP